MEFIVKRLEPFKFIHRLSADMDHAGLKAEGHIKSAVKVVGNDTGFTALCTPFHSNGKAFGGPGAGGFFGFADPDMELGYAWAPNKLGVQLFDDPREVACRKAVCDAIRRLS